VRRVAPSRQWRHADILAHASEVPTPVTVTTQYASPRRIALKVDVDTFRGTELGVPRLVELLGRFEAGATFLFSLGPDHTGRAIKRVFRPGFMQKVGRTSVLKNYGLKTLLYGTLLPGPDIGQRCADTLRMVRDCGFETGIHTWDHVKWQDGVAKADAKWTMREMHRAVERFEAIFSKPPRVHGAAGWQMNVHSYRLTQRLGFDFCSDTRGFCPYIPIVDAEIVACPQIPTTLPTLDELIGVDGINASNVAATIARMSMTTSAPAGHVFTLHAELEGIHLLPAFEELLNTWRRAGIELMSLGGLLASFGTEHLPRHRTTVGTVSGRSGTLALQGPEFLPRSKPSCT
jgi:undecaprenyl phosphate-alpha-L-ara4FN deformylase